MSYVVYADFECVLKKIDNKGSFAVKAEKHEPCGFSYIIVRSDARLLDRSHTERGKDAVFTFLVWLQNHEREMREDMANKRQLVMTNEDWQKHRNATECHICNKSLVKDLFLESISVHHPNSGKYCGQSHRICYFMAKKNFIGPQRERKENDEIDQQISNNQEICLFCKYPLLVANYKDSVKDHDHMTGRYHGAPHNDCNFKPKLNAKTAPISVFFHNLKGYDGNPADASDGAGAWTNKMHTHKHREIHFILTGKCEV